MKSKTQETRDTLQKALYKNVGGWLSASSVEQLIDCIDLLIECAIKETASESIKQAKIALEKELQIQYNKGVNDGYQSALRYMSKENKND